ncbi:MAG: hypothetical protein RL660_1125 [Bacteroidota bacterium]|jgi:hypothetical protein
MENINDLQNQYEQITKRKREVIIAQHFDEASQLRDQEKIIEQKIEQLIKDNKIMLSKSKFVRGQQCHKNLWLYTHKKDVATEASEAQAAIFQSGTDVGVLARDYFPNGVLAVAEGEYPNKATAAYTQQLIDKGATTIYEATFIYNDVLVAVDVLHKYANEWHFFEVKSSTSVKDCHLTDTAIQYYVLKNCLQAKVVPYVMILNNQYVFRNQLNVKELFIATNTCEEVSPLQTEIPNQLQQMKIMLLKDEPQIEMGDHCNKPFACEFAAYCSGSNAIEEIETNSLSNTPIINKEAIVEFKEQVHYPIGFLDFETIMPAVPQFNESRPYQQLVFQYSLHTQATPNSKIKHFELLAENSAEPREQIIKHMLATTNKLQTIFVYNIGFERTCIKDMARDFPKYAIELIALADKLVDLMPIFKKHYRTEQMQKRYSIKVVLPALVSDMSYDDLAIGNGTDASNAYFELYNCSDKEHISATRNHLIEYCKLDTLAMVKLWEKILEVR